MDWIFLILFGIVWAIGTPIIAIVALVRTTGVRDQNARLAAELHELRQRLEQGQAAPAEVPASPPSLPPPLVEEVAPPAEPAPTSELAPEPVPPLPPQWVEPAAPAATSEPAAPAAPAASGSSEVHAR